MDGPEKSAAMSLQLATGCRYVDLEKLKVQHVELCKKGLPVHQYMVTFVGGKTDLASTGQSVILERLGTHSKNFIRWLKVPGKVSGEKLFPGLNYVKYNKKVKSCTGLRHVS
eukprot:TRINITY_DN569_c0_g1_i3.p5 TRINITY_DN569_c0_g1~~TRINITY_DN569_c0_g1_i3.p5  ORF type:complete len:112 (+),score=16.89 TRINITY_DN569_c0_g1_i3:1375-1710(+)